MRREARRERALPIGGARESGHGDGRHYAAVVTWQTSHLLKELKTIGRWHGDIRDE